MEDDVEIGASERINALRLVAHNAEAAVGPETLRLVGVKQRVIALDDQSRQRILNPVRVLKLVDHHVAEPVVVVAPSLFRVAEQLYRADQQVVEIERVRRLQPLLVKRVDSRDGLTARAAPSIRLPAVTVGVPAEALGRQRLPQRL